MKRRNGLRMAVLIGSVAVAALASAQAVPFALADGAGQVEGDGGGHRPPYPPPSPQPSPTQSPPIQLPPPPPQDAWAWTQLVPAGAQVRFVTPAGSCPILVVTTGGQPVRRQMVQESTVSMYPTTATVCTRLVPPAATAARIDVTTSPVPVNAGVNGAVPLPNWTQLGAATSRPANIAEIGDTGCRIPAVGAAQVCQNTPSNWPLQNVANAAAARPVPPDLVIHTGDYIYRTLVQTQPAPLCGGPSTSLNYRTWGCLVTDFFEPAAALLRTAPFVFVRGNHETCQRAGEVWFRYLAPTLSTTACSPGAVQDYSPPVRLNAGTLGLLLTDTSCAGDDLNPPTCDTASGLARYTAQFNQVNNTLVRPGDNFLLSHTPIWAVVAQNMAGNPVWITPVLENAVAATTVGMLDARIDLILSGHVHLYQMLDFGTATPRRPPQVTVGDSGTALDDKNWQDANLINKPVDGVPLVHLVTVRDFGYAVLRDVGTTWNLRHFDQAGAVVPGTNCNLVGSEFPNCV
ncbi:metallophosphoesterase [Micromonospora mirobrigensis]|uniref:Calcineurin-like phosphoesterase n=1 Tax=Micromonospora mirobrigensis TaxID=262898 RepID=A0A1C5AMR3_9ACTN|nr:metallophosphoesterase [Micromonospora mirobrigensis]SCF46371.1 Calcineurin-like phosphoesterase [Micromonospora mirobrigensis]